MAITNFKKQVEQPDDDYRSLLCTEPGCGRKWSVKIDKPMCSFHQWKDDKPKAKRNIAALLPDKQKTVAQWYDDKDDAEFP